MNDGERMVSCTTESYFETAFRKAGEATVRVTESSEGLCRLFVMIKSIASAALLNQDQSRYSIINGVHDHFKMLTVLVAGITAFPSALESLIYDERQVHEAKFDSKELESGYLISNAIISICRVLELAIETDLVDFSEEAVKLLSFTMGGLSLVPCIRTVTNSGLDLFFNPFNPDRVEKNIIDLVYAVTKMVLILFSYMSNTYLYATLAIVNSGLGVARIVLY